MTTETPPSNGFDMLDSGFQEKLTMIASRRPGLTPLGVFKLWNEYTDKYSSQSCTLHEFHRAYARQIGDEYGFRVNDLVCDDNGYIGEILAIYGNATYAIRINGEKSLRYANQLTLIRNGQFNVFTFVSDDDDGHRVKVLTNKSDLVDAIIHKAVECDAKYEALRHTKYGSDHWDALTEQWKESAALNLNWYYWEEHAQIPLNQINPC